MLFIDYILIIDPPVAVNNISVNPVNNNTIFINWFYQNQQNIQCIVNYRVIVNDSNESPSQYNYSSVGNNTNITVDNLIIGANYSFIIIPIDTIGREGPPSSLIQYIWNGKNYIHTHTHCISYSTSSSC